MSQKDNVLANFNVDRLLSNNTNRKVNASGDV